MSDCRKTETVEACITLDDGSGSVSILHTTVFDDSGAAIAGYYHDEAGAVVDEATYRGGGAASLGGCVTTVGHIAYCITDPDDPTGVLKAFKLYNSDGTFGERMLLTDIDPDAAECC